MQTPDIFVTKRDGRKEKFDESKIMRAVYWACDGLDVEPKSILDKTFLLLRSEITTAEVQRALTIAAADLIKITCMDASFAAARLTLLDLYKTVRMNLKIEDNDSFNMQYPHLRTYLTHAVKTSNISEKLLGEGFDLDKLNAVIDPSCDLKFQYMGITTLISRYFIREYENKKVIELPQHFLMRVAMGIALAEKPELRTEKAIEFYNLYKNLDFLSSTPTLFNSGTTHSQLSSCYVNHMSDSLSDEEDDTQDNRYKSIMGTVDETARFSKFAGGIGTNMTAVRSQGSHIKTTNGISSGIVPYIKVLNNTLLAVNQGGKRPGSAAVYLEPWHADYMDFIDLRKNSGEERLRAHDIYPASWIPSLFMQRVKEKGNWSFFSPKDNEVLYNTWGDEFNEHYERLEKEGKAVKTVPAMDVWRKLLTSIYQTGFPWFTFKDNFNRRNPQAHAGIIRSSNLCCVAADQRVVTEKGILTVGEMYRRQDKNIVVGIDGYSNASEMLLPRPNAPMVRLETAEGYTHKITPDHRVWKVGFGWIEAQYLIPGDKLLIQQHEGLFGQLDKPDLGLIAGLVAGDGTFADQSVCIDLWSNKTLHLASYLEVAIAKLLENQPTSTTSTTTPKFSYYGDTAKARLSSAPLYRLLAEHGFTRETKLRVPDFIWKGNKHTVSAYLRGLYISDAVIQSCNGTATLSLTSTSKEFLQELQILWANYGVKTTVCKGSEGGERDFGEERGGVYECKPNYRLLITSIQGCQIAERELCLTGFRDTAAVESLNTQLTKHGYKQKLYATFTGLMPLPNEDAYCLMVDSDTHAWVCNGLVTHNTEIGLNTSEEESAVCNLGSINLANHITDGKPDWAKLEKTVKTAIRMLDNVIDVNFYPSKRASKSNLQHRPIGLGVMGYYEYLAKMGVKFASRLHLEKANELFERINFYATEASMELAIEKGKYPSFEGSTWSKGILTPDTETDETRYSFTGNLDWDSLRTKVKLNGMRNSNLMAIAPTATISNIVGTTPCIEVPYLPSYTKSNLNGPFTVIEQALRYIPLEDIEDFFNVDQNWVIESAAVRQRWICQAQSVNIALSLNPPNGMKPAVYLNGLYMKAHDLRLKSTYYLRNQSDDDAQKLLESMKMLNSQLEEAKVAEPEQVEDDISLEDLDLGKACSIDNPDCESCQ